MRERELNELIMELKSNQAKAKHEHYEAMTRVDTKCGLMVFILAVGIVAIVSEFTLAPARNYTESMVPYF